LIRYFQPKERYLLRYDQASESVLIPPPEDQEIMVITEDRLKTLDKELAPYPFNGLQKWKALTSEITQQVIQEVVGETGRLDGMTPVEGEASGSRDTKGGTGKEEQELAAMFGLKDERKLRFVEFDLKRSWRDGAVGEEVTKYSRDKSWLLGKVVGDLGGGE
jgi:A1 cistron-splicing factor AAR2